MFDKVKAKFAMFSREEDGATLVEYGIALGIAVAVGAGVVTAIGTNTGENFTGACTALGGTEAECAAGG